MPFRHVALYRWADHVDDDHVQRVGEAFDELAARVSGTLAVTHGSDVGFSGGSFDYVVVIDVDTEASWRTLRDHPSYILLVEELITRHVDERADAQFRIGGEATGVPADVDLQELSDEELLAQARRAAQASMDALLAEPDDVL